MIIDDRDTNIYITVGLRTNKVWVVIQYPPVLLFWLFISFSYACEGFFRVLPPGDLTCILCCSKKNRVITEMFFIQQLIHIRYLIRINKFSIMSQM